MESQLLLTYWDIHGHGISPEHLINHKEQLIFDSYNRTLLTQGDQIGNHYMGSYHGEVFNDFTHNIATGDYSSASGKCTTASNVGEYAVGRYNKSTNSTAASQSTLFSVGYGTSESDRKNAFEIKHNGVAYFTRETYVGNMPVFSYVSNSYAYSLAYTKNAYADTMKYVQSYMASSYNKLYSYATFHQVDVDTSTMIGVRNSSDNGTTKLFINKTSDGVLFIDQYNKLTGTLYISKSSIEYDSENQDITISCTLSNGLISSNTAVLSGSNLPSKIELHESGTFGTVTVNKNTNTSWTMTLNDGADTKNEQLKASLTWKYVYMYGKTQPSGSNFYDSSHIRILATTKPSTNITINQADGEYAYFTLPASWGTPKFTDISIGLEGGWSKIGSFTSPYSNSLVYDVYRTVNSGLGNITWKIS